MNKKSILNYLIFPIALCGVLVALTNLIESLDFLTGLAIFTISLLLVNLLLFVISYFKKNNLGLKILPFTIGFVFWMIGTTVVLLSELKSTEDEIIDQLEAFNKDHAHYPYCLNSSELVDSLGINLNYISANEIKYEFNKKENYCVIKFWDDSIVYDSKSKTKVIKK